MANQNVDPATLSDEEIRDAITYHCWKMGSRGYYYADEVARWKRDPSCLRVYREEDTGKLRAYTETKRDG